VTGYLKWRRERIAAAAAGAEMVETALGPVELKVVGAGLPVLISHGALGGYDLAPWAAKHMGLEHHRLIAPSRPGYLRTPLASGPSWSRQADLFAAVLDRLGIRSVAVIGVSAGGGPAVQFAARHPDRCQALVLCSAVTRPMPWGARIAWTAVPVHVVTELAAWSILPWALPAMARRNGWPNPEALTDLINCSTPCMPRHVGWREDLRAAGQIEIGVHRLIQAPTLILHGERDPLVPAAHARATAAEIADSELEIYPGGTHVLADSHPETATRIAEFLARRFAAEALG
jgi:pimeloyl-ACP methyl ester carboxylesterase